VILLDLMMPGIDGWDFRMEQKRDAALADIPVIAISAAGKLLDADHSLRKPIQIEALLTLLRTVMGGGRH
jgi:CheY-like chemotaxis protein